MATENSSMPRRDWWSARRRRYNIILITAALISGLLLLVVWALFEDRLPCLEITAFSIVFGAIFFFFGLGVANICYFLRPLSERIFRPKEPLAFRRIVFGLGLAVSLLLIFSPPVLNLLFAIFVPPAQTTCEL
jgi:hypothetical protein